MAKSPAAVLRAWAKKGGELERGIDEIQTADEALAVLEALDALREHRASRYDPDGFGSPLHQLTAFFQSAGSKEVFELFTREGLPKLRTWVRAALTGERVSDNDLLFILKMLAGYRQLEDVALIAEVARRPIDPEGFLWSVVLGMFDGEHPHAAAMVDALRDPLPPGFIGVTYLDMANQLAIAGALSNHPFDTAAGIARLRGFLSDPKEENFSYAHSATAALPFVRERAPLLALARAHPDTSVKMEAAWAAGKTGDATGLADLVELCLQPAHSAAAQQYLEELGHASLVPAAAREPKFVALAEMARWLAHPNELGRVPETIEIYDIRELYWPPTDDRRQVALVRYEDEKDEGVGMVGSVTFALFGETTADLPPEDIYGLHCCWELEMNGDARAPKKRSAKAGRKLLAKYNPGF